MDYRGIFEDAVDALRQEKRYRVFADLERIAGRFPRAIYRDSSDNAREIAIWCSNDYLGMGQHPVTIAAMQDTAGKLGVGAGGTRNISGTNRPWSSLSVRSPTSTARRGPWCLPQASCPTRPPSPPLPG